MGEHGTAGRSLGRDISYATPPIDATRGWEAVRRAKLRMKSAAVRLETARNDYTPRDPESANRTPLRSKCLRHAVPLDSVMLEGYASGRVGVHGVLRCHSLAECPWCAEEEAAKRADVVRDVVKRFERDGGGVVYFATLTCRHHHGDDLAALRRAICRSWSAIWNGKVAAKAKRRLDLDGFVRALDVTHGRNGWHPHLHALIFARTELSDAALRRFERWVFTRWRRQFAKLGLEEPTRERGVQIERARSAEGSAEYIVKMGLGREVTSAWEKRSKRSGHRTPWGILLDIADHNRPADIALWNAWASAMRGARWLTWSRGLRERWAITRDRTTKRTEPVLRVAVPAAVWMSKSHEEIADQLDDFAVEAIHRAAVEMELERFVSAQDSDPELLAPAGVG